MLIDTHAHLNQLSFFPVNIEYPVISVSTNLDSCRSNIQSPHKPTNKVYFACGLHPWFVNDRSFNELPMLFDFICSNNIKIMGEIGLDFSANYKHNKQDQIQVLDAQLKYAYEHQLPVSLHLVKAFDALYDLLKKYPVNGAIHSFPGSYEQAQRFSRLGIMIGINGLILRDNTSRYHHLVKNLPLESMVLETDAPNINYPDNEQGNLEMLPLIAAKVSDIKGVDLNEVHEITTKNAITSFKLNEY